MLKHKRRFWLIGLLFAAVLALAACAPPAEETGVSEGDTAEEAIQPEEEATEEMTDEPTEEAMATNAVEVEDQELGENDTVVVPSATSDGPGWVVIHAEADGAPGPVIGFAAVSAGENTNVEVELDPDGVTDTLYAMLHIDAGTEGEYEFPGDDGPARDADDNVVVKPFAVSRGEESGMDGEAVVTVLDGSFDEEELTVPVGTTVVWEQDGSFAHTVTADDGSFDSGTLNSGQRFSFTFDEPGTYPYYCEFHGGEGGSGMSGVITVEG